VPYHLCGKKFLKYLLILRGFTAEELCDPRAGAVDRWLLLRLAAALLRVCSFSSISL
jgi:hypothetical protein